MRTGRVILMVIASTCLIAGCAPAVPISPPDASAAPTRTPPPSPTPTSTPVAAPAKPAVEDLVVSPEGLGPLVPGLAPPVTDPAVDILVFDPDACNFSPDGSDYVPLPEDSGLWISNYGVDPATYDLGPFGVVVQEGLVLVIGIYSQEIETEAGAHLGLTREELLRIYPSELEFIPGSGVDSYRLPGRRGDLMFSLSESESGTYTVFQINVSTPGFTVPTGGSDYGFFGICYGP